MFPVEVRMTPALRCLYISYLHNRRWYYGLLKQRDRTYRKILKFWMRDIIRVRGTNVLISKLLDTAFHSRNVYRLNSVKTDKKLFVHFWTRNVLKNVRLNSWVKESRIMAKLFSRDLYYKYVKYWNGIRLLQERVLHRFIGYLQKLTNFIINLFIYIVAKNDDNELQLGKSDV